MIVERRGAAGRERGPRAGVPQERLVDVGAVDVAETGRSGRRAAGVVGDDLLSGELVAGQDGEVCIRLRLALEPGGFTEISRGLRSDSDDTPGSRTKENALHPGGMPDERASVSEKRPHKICEHACGTCPMESLMHPCPKPPYLSSLRDEETNFFHPDPGVSLALNPRLISVIPPG